MTQFAQIAALLAVGTWLGTIVFQAAIVAPSVFASLEEAAARRFLRTLFPRFYVLGLACGIVALVLFGAVAVVSAWPAGLKIAVVLVAVMTVLQAVSLGLVPRINAARDAGPPGEAAFARLHRLSVVFTLLNLLLGVAAFAAAVRLPAAG